MTFEGERSFRQHESNESAEKLPPSEIIEAAKEYQAHRNQIEPVLEKMGQYDGDSPEYREIFDKEFLPLSQQGDELYQKYSGLDLAHAAAHLKEPLDWHFKHWVVGRKIDEQLRQAKSVNAPQLFGEYENRWSGVSQEWLRQHSYDIDSKLAEYDFSPNLNAVVKNMERLYGEEADRVALLTLVKHEILESN